MTMKRAAILSSLCIVTAMTAMAAESADERCRLADKSVEDAIHAKATALKGDEYCQYRRYDALDDLDHDGRADLVVAFNRLEQRR